MVGVQLYEDVTSAQTSLNVALNWFEELKRLMPNN